MSDGANATPPGTRVLVVDDHEISRRSTVAALRETAGTVKQARTFREALEVALAWQPDVVCTDLDLDGESGVDFIRTLRRKWPPGRPWPSVVVLSGDLEGAHSNGLSALDVRCTLTKPVDPDRLRQAIEPGAGAFAPSAIAPEERALEKLFDRELRRRLPRLDGYLAKRDLASAARMLHQLVAASAICKHCTLERRLRELWGACHKAAPPEEIAIAYFSVLRAAAPRLTDTAEKANRSG